MMNQRHVVCPKCSTTLSATERKGPALLVCPACLTGFEIPARLACSEQTPLVASGASVGPASKTYYVARKGQRSGPFSLGQLKQMVAEGACAAEDWLWSEGDSDWRPLLTAEGVFPPESKSGVLPESPASALAVETTGRGSQRVCELAKAQRRLLQCVLFEILALFALLLPLLFGILAVVLVIFQTIFINRLARALGEVSPGLWAVGGLIPFVNFVLAAILSSKATTVLSRAGYRVGLMGAKVNPVRAH